MITVAAWAAHAVIYPVFTVYLWCLTPGARAFEDYMETVDVLEHARV